MPRTYLLALLAVSACARPSPVDEHQAEGQPSVNDVPVLARTSPAAEGERPNPAPRIGPAKRASMSVGSPNRGALYNGALMTDGPHWAVVNPKRAWGTDETVASVIAAIDSVNRTFPESPKLYVGDISAPRGGYIRPHHSHQSGRDVDLGLYYSKGPAWYVRARADNLDRARSWALVKALIDDPNVEVIFVDRSIQRLLREYATTAGETKERLDALFEERTAFSNKLIRHEWGHLTHLHVRFKCPESVEAGERATREVALVHKPSGSKYY